MMQRLLKNFETNENPNACEMKNFCSKTFFGMTIKTSEVILRKIYFQRHTIELRLKLSGRLFCYKSTVNDHFVMRAVRFYIYSLVIFFLRSILEHYESVDRGLLMLI